MGHAMSKTTRVQEPEAPASQEAAISHLVRSLKGGGDWPTSLLEAMALWTTPQETYRSRQFNYFIGGEAFDWLLLAERLLESAGNLVPQEDKEHLLFTGRFPPSFDDAKFKGLLGVDKYRGTLNYFYGVTVEEALQLAVELEIQKRHASNGVQYREDFSEEVFAKIYRASREELLEKFREDAAAAAMRSMSLSQSREFTYWLFKRRLKTLDNSKVASDTRKGLEQLRRMGAPSRVPALVV